MKYGDLSVIFFTFGFLLMMVAISMPAVLIGEKMVAISVLLLGGSFVAIGFNVLREGEKARVH